jgi:hypothetical protein
LPETAGNLIGGTYTTIRDGGLTYTYRGTWSQFERQILWRADVTLNGEFKGTPSDVLHPVTSVAPENLVRRMIHDAIERMARVRR